MIRLRQEFLLGRPGRPLHSYEHEKIGDGIAKGFTGKGRLPAVQRPAYLAKVQGADPTTGGLKLSFLRGDRDYSAANGCGSRGIMEHFLLQEGPVYAFRRWKTWNRGDEGYFRVVNGERVHMTRTEVHACLER